MVDERTVGYIRGLFENYPSVEFSSNGIQGILLADYRTDVTIEEVQEALFELVESGEVETLSDGKTYLRYISKDH